MCDVCVVCVRNWHQIKNYGNSTHIHAYTCTDTYTHTHIHKYTHTHTHTPLHLFLHKPHMNAQQFLCGEVLVHMRIVNGSNCVCVCVCVCVWRGVCEWCMSDVWSAMCACMHIWIYIMCICVWGSMCGWECEWCVKCNMWCVMCALCVMHDEWWCMMYDA